MLLFRPDSGAPVAGSNFVPLDTIRWQLERGDFARQLIGNSLLLVPIGFTFRVWGVSVRRVLIALVVLAVSIEVGQGLVDRVTDVDDLILNVFGGFVGALIGSGMLAIYARITKRADSSDSNDH